MGVIRLNDHEGEFREVRGQSGIVWAIMQAIGSTNRFCVEFGAGRGGTENNTLNLKQHGYTCLWMDARYPDASIPIHQEFITAENVAAVFSRHRVLKSFDVLSIDIDRNDWYVLRSVLDSGYRPRCIVVEYNSSLGPFDDAVVVYDAKGVWDGTNYFGASVAAYAELAHRYGYEIVACDSSGIDVFMVEKENSGLFSDAGDVRKLYHAPRFGHRHANGSYGHPQDTKKRRYLRAADLLNGLSL